VPDTRTEWREPALEQRLDALGAALSARAQLGPEPDYRARLLRYLTHGLRSRPYKAL
jgi:hypothetical protein